MEHKDQTYLSMYADQVVHEEMSKICVESSNANENPSDWAYNVEHEQLNHCYILQGLSDETISVVILLANHSHLLMLLDWKQLTSEAKIHTDLHQVVQCLDNVLNGKDKDLILLSLQIQLKANHRCTI